MEKIIKDLYKLDSRWKGVLLLANLSIDDLKIIVRILDIPLQTSKEKIKYSIIERTIGFRLRSAAIQNKNV